VPIKLSICIPTYNRAKFLPELFDSIRCSDPEQIQIAVSDNASTDNTAEVVEEYRKRFPHFDYKRNETNIGPDRNYLAAAAMASGEYCLIMGSDDAFAHVGIDKIFDYLKNKPDILLYNCIKCNFYLDKIIGTKFTNYKKNPTLISIFNEDDIVNYFDNCLDYAGCFSYLSSSVFKTNKLSNNYDYKKYVGTAYSAAAILLMIMRDGCLLCYTPECLVLHRGENDSFFTGSVTERIFLDIYGFKKISNSIFKKEKKAAAALMRIVYRTHMNAMGTLRGFLRVKFFMSNNDWIRYKRELYSINIMKNKFSFFDAITPDIMLHNRLIVFLLKVYYSLKKKYTNQRLFPNIIE
jgi:abequosyltransferase